jgi:UDP-N-acetylmuramoylalanine--D-glutamate ligase
MQSPHKEPKPTLFGYGLTTKAIAKKLSGGCTFFDDTVETPYHDEEGNHICPSHTFDATKSHLEVTTPSLPPHHPLIQSAQNLKSEYDYLAEEMPYSIWISGTNGKTTTTQMLTHLLEKRGAVSGGNIGTPLAMLNTHAPIWVLETSSFTLHHTHIASPNLYILLPITEDHLDWHGSLEAYQQAKLRPLRTMKKGELAIVPKGLPLPQSDAFIVEYESSEEIATYFGIDPTQLNYKAAFLQDALLALAVTKVLFDEIDYTHMNHFKLDAHRQEPFRDTHHRLWINDSKATNVDATIQALKAYEEDTIHLIIGGVTKGQNFLPLFQLMQNLNITLYIIGNERKTFITLSKQFNIPFQETITLQEAVKTIHQHHTPKSIALLSPATASFDQFSSYKERGEKFLEEIQKLL